MKKILTLILVLVSMNAIYAQGVKKTTKQQQPKQVVQPSADSVVIKGTYKVDTAKVIAVLYVEDGSMTWIKGYAVVKYFIPAGGQPLTTSQTVYNGKWEAIKPEDIYDIRQAIQ